MCLFITVLLPKDADMGELAPLIEKYGLDLYAYESGGPLSKLRPNDICYSPRLHPHCDCGTDLGKAKHHEQYVEHMREYVQREKDKRNAIASEGKKSTLWSRVRQRFSKRDNEFDLFEIYEEDLKRIDEGEKWPNGWERDDLDIWMGFLREVLASDNTDHVGIVIGWVSGADTLPEKVTRVQRVLLDELKEDVLLNMEEDVLYEFLKKTS